MQLGESLYIDLEIEDLNRKNFIQYDDMVRFEIIETAGTSLPIVYMAFKTRDFSIAQYIKECNNVKVKIGETEENADTFLVQIHNIGNPANDPSGTSWAVEFAGFIINRLYMVNMETRSYWGNSLLVTQRVLYDYFGAKLGNGFKTTVTRTNENQVRWRRHMKTACSFLAETLVHMDITPSFPIFSFDKYGTFHLTDFDSLVKSTPVASFVPYKPKKTNEIQYFNTLSVESFKDNYNLYSGYNKVTEIYGAKTGIPEYTISDNTPVLAATQESDKVQLASRNSYNVIQSANVHNTYVSAFVYNTNKLMAMSSMCGVVKLEEKYYRNLKPTDLVMVSTGGDDEVLGGLYLIDTIRTKACMDKGMLETYVYVTRDNSNNVENYIANPKKGIKIKKKFLTDLLNAVSRLRVAYAMGMRIIDGTYMKQVMSFAIMTKNNLLRAFSVNGVTIDFTSSANLIASLINVGNSLMNTLLSMIFPSQIANIFRDFIIRKPSLRALLSRYIATYVPYEIRDIVSAIVDAIFDSTDTLNSIAKDNGISVTSTGGATEGSAISETGGDTVVDTTNTSEVDYTENSQELVGNIISDFENNTTGLDIPFPIIELTESQALLPDPELRNFVASETIANLTNLGYLDGMSQEEVEDFKEILLGNQPIDFNMIDKINKNAGSTYSYRLWGTYKDLTELTDFFIKKGYKDKYRTIPCTKIINAMGSTKIFFTCPAKEDNLKFYINSKRIEVVEDLEALIEEYYVLLDELNVLEAELARLIEEGASEEIIEAKRAEVEAKKAEVEAKDYTKKLVLGKFNMNLGYVDVYGNPIPYTIYYTNKGFNSTGVIFEVKQGGMV